MHYFERRLHARDDGARVWRPFEWGLEFLDTGHDSMRDAHSARQFIKEFNEETLASSEGFSPQWNAKEDSHVALCRGLNRFGVSALRLSLPFHDQRMLDGFTRADFLVSANIGRTTQAVRQAGLDIRRAADWLFFNFFRRLWQ
ncbi:MAG: hypothetical protein ACREA2_16470 [Blastocatellia bacterium]